MKGGRGGEAGSSTGIYTNRSQKEKGESGFRYICLAIKSLPHDMNMACTFVSLVLPTFQMLSEN